MIRFNLNGQWTEERTIDPNWTVLRYLRSKTEYLAAKEGCAGGDCGACSVLLGMRENGLLQYKAVNACIALLGSLDGQYIVTVEGLTGSGQLHPVQQAMVDYHGSQCGFCTPGIISSLAALYHNRALQNEGKSELGPPSERDIHVALSGNLCRCTGYRPIIDAAKAMNNYPAPTENAAVMQSTVGVYDPACVQGTDPALESEGRRLFVPENEAQLKHILSDYPNARLWAGGTDLGLEITQQFKQFDVIVSLHKVSALAEVAENENDLRFGAMVTYSQAERFLSHHKQFPSFVQLIERIGSRQVRNLGTLGGNIANASPIGDTPPVFLALNARIEIASAQGNRDVPIENFIKGYKQTDLKEGEYLRSIIVPKLSKNQALKIFKISKRKEDDISAVLMATHIEHRDGVIRDVRIACGGMAATPLRAKHTEAALIGQSYELSSFEQAAEQIVKDYQPINDVRATAEYRLMVASNLIIKTGLALMEETGNQTKGGK